MVQFVPLDWIERQAERLRAEHLIHCPTRQSIEAFLPGVVKWRYIGIISESRYHERLELQWSWVSRADCRLSSEELRRALSYPDAFLVRMADEVCLLNERIEFFLCAFECVRTHYSVTQEADSSFKVIMYGPSERDASFLLAEMAAVVQEVQ